MNKKEILAEIRGHSWGSTGIKDLNFWKEVSNVYSNCLYHGNAYRVVFVPEGQLEDDKGLSYSGSLNGIWSYIIDGKNYDMHRDEGFYLINSNIVGISLAHITAFERSLGNDVERMPLREDEIILLETISVINISYHTLKTFPTF